MRRAELPSGGWAMLREANEITVGGRRRIERARMGLRPELRQAFREAARIRREAEEAEKAGLTPSGEEVPDFEPDERDLACLFRLTDATVLAVVSSWSYEAPVAEASFDELPDRDLRKLQLLCSPAVLAGEVDFSDPGPEAEPDEAIPFGNSTHFVND